MKRILFILALLSACSPAFSQFVAPAKGPTAFYTQLWNPASFYYNTVTSASQLGKQLDTITNVASLNLESSQFFIGANGNPASYSLSNNPTTGISAIINLDTVIVYPIDGSGQLTITSEVYKCTGTDTVILTPISSSDGVYWAAIPGATAITIEPTSLTVPVVTKWILTSKPDKYVGLQVSNQKTSSSVSVRSQMYFLKPTTLNKDL